MSRRSQRNRGRAQLAVKARPGPPGITFTTGQVQALLAAQPRGSMTATPLPRPPGWATSPFPPGRPLPPAAIDRIRPGAAQAEPRLAEYPVAWNLQLAARTYVPWKTLRDAANLPLFRKCIEARKAICSLGFAVTVDPVAVARAAAASGEPERDIEAKLRKDNETDIARVSDWLEYPDRGNGLDWENWCRLLMENRLTYDATVVYPKRTYGGQAFSWEVSDGALWKPLIDEHGRRPLPPYPAFQQVLYGYARGEYTADVDPADVDPETGKLRPGAAIPNGYQADSLVYERTIARPQAVNGYGISATEIALLDGYVWMRRMGWILAEYTDGVTPHTWLENTGEGLDWTVEQWEDWALALNDHLSGQTRERMRAKLLPPGLHAVEPSEVAERYKPDYDMFLIKLIAGDFGLTATELGFPEVGSLGASFHEGEEDVLNRKTRIPDANWLGRIATRLARRQLGMAPALKVKILGLESEDETAHDAVLQNQVNNARKTLNEARADAGDPPYEFDEADMPMLLTQRGVVFVEGSSKVAPPGTLIEPAHVEEPPGAGDGTGTGDGAPAGNPRVKRAAAAGKQRGKTAVKALADAGARVYEQLAEDYPPDALDWVHHAKWAGPVNVPLSHVDQAGRAQWAASHEPAKVAHFREQIRRKGKTKPIILVKRPGKPTLLNADGHHRYLAYEAEHLPPRAFIGVVDRVKGPWDEMHDKQFDTAQERAQGRKPDDTAYESSADKALAEVSAFRRWAARRASPPRPFQCAALTKDLAAALAPDLLADPRIALKASPPKVLARTFAGTGPAGSGTCSS